MPSSLPSDFPSAAPSIPPTMSPTTTAEIGSRLTSGAGASQVSVASFCMKLGSLVVAVLLAM
jgi:hypothetical protein